MTSNKEEEEKEDSYCLQNKKGTKVETTKKVHGESIRSLAHRRIYEAVELIVSPRRSFCGLVFSSYRRIYCHGFLAHGEFPIV